jgi:hypothetical protein
MFIFSAVKLLILLSLVNKFECWDQADQQPLTTTSFPVTDKTFSFAYDHFNEFASLPFDHLRQLRDRILSQMEALSSGEKGEKRDQRELLRRLTYRYLNRLPPRFG